MQVLAFAATRRAVLEDAGGVTTEGFPMTSCYVESFPAQLNLPIVLPMFVDGPGIYSIGLYADAAGSEPEFWFPLSVLAATAN